MNNDDLSYRILLIDENMLYMNGHETVEIIRRLEEKRIFRRILIFLVSAEGHVDERKERFYDGFINKPFDRRCILSMLKKSGVLM